MDKEIIVIGDIEIGAGTLTDDFISDNTLIAYCKGTVLQNLSTDSCTGESTIIAEKDCALNFFGDPIDQSCFKVKGMPGYYADCFKEDPNN